MYDTTDNKKVSILKDIETYHSNNTEPTKQCYCVGPDKCNDTTCRLVKEHLGR
jgi:hypothetical protein